MDEELDFDYEDMDFELAERQEINRQIEEEYRNQIERFDGWRKDE